MHRLSAQDVPILDRQTPRFNDLDGWVCRGGEGI
jgi:hypothetical protein